MSVLVYSNDIIFLTKSTYPNVQKCEKNVKGETKTGKNNSKNIEH